MVGIVTISASEANHKVIEVITDVADCDGDISLDLKKGGTELGLPIVKKIVEVHEGTLEILDKFPNRNVFRVILPM